MVFCGLNHSQRLKPDCANGKQWKRSNGLKSSLKV